MGATPASWGSLRPLVLAVAVLLAAGGAWGQTEWIKYEGNPVLTVGGAGSWDSAWAGVLSVLAEGGGYRAWYIGSSADAMAIGYATSPDGASWTKRPEPIFEARESGWDGAGVGNPAAVVFDGSVYHMWYTAWSDADVWSIGYATAPLPFPEPPLLLQDGRFLVESMW
jgi:hypothetical protein